MTRLRLSEQTSSEMNRCMLLQDLEGPSFHQYLWTLWKLCWVVFANYKLNRKISKWITLTLIEILRIKHTFLEPIVIVIFVNTAYFRRNLLKLWNNHSRIPLLSSQHFRLLYCIRNLFPHDYRSRTISLGKLSSQSVIFETVSFIRGIGQTLYDNSSTLHILLKYMVIN